MKKVIIVGSSRNDGDTWHLVNQIVEKSGWDVVNLNDYNFGYYDYDHKNRHDGYLDLMQIIIEKYDTFIFATPVYWYAMSGILKVFFDRMTDLLTIEKDLGRQLRGKKMAVVTSSTGSNLGEHFWLPFTATAAYLGMYYLANMHTVPQENNELKIVEFIGQIDK